MDDDSGVVRYNAMLYNFAHLIGIPESCQTRVFLDNFVDIYSGSE